MVTRRSLVDRLDALELKPWAEVAERDQWLRIVVDHVTGRRVLPVARGER